MSQTTTNKSIDLPYSSQLILLALLLSASLLITSCTSRNTKNTNIVTSIKGIQSIETTKFYTRTSKPKKKALLQKTSNTSRYGIQISYLVKPKYHEEKLLQKSNTSKSTTEQIKTNVSKQYPIKDTINARFLQMSDRRCRSLPYAKLQQRVSLYMPTIQKMAKKYQLSERLLLSVIYIESCFNKTARSPAGAQGLMQLMPNTARLMQVRNSYNPSQNIEGGSRYLRKMLNRYKNNTRLALAAYNAGPGAVDKYNGIPPYQETQNYVKKIMARITGG